MREPRFEAFPKARDSYMSAAKGFLAQTPYSGRRRHGDWPLVFGNTRGEAEGLRGLSWDLKGQERTAWAGQGS